MFEKLTAYGIVNDGRGLDFFISEKDKETARDRVPKLPYVCLVLGANYYTKRIPVEVTEKIIQGSPHPVVLIGGKDVQVAGEQLHEKYTEKVINLCGTINIGSSAAVLGNSFHVVTGDTGMMHIAAALQRPITVLWGSTIPTFGMGPYYGDSDLAPAHMEVENLSCRPCSKLGYNSCPKGHFKCMMDQNVDKLFN